MLISTNSTCLETDGSSSIKLHMISLKNRKAQAGLIMLAGASSWMAYEVRQSQDAEQKVAHLEIKTDKIPTKYRSITPHKSDDQEDSKPVLYRAGLDESFRSDKELLGEAPLSQAVDKRREDLRVLRLGIDSSIEALPIQVALGDETRELAINSSQRLESIKTLTLNGISEKELEFVYDFIGEGIAPEGMSDGEYHWLADELFISLRNQKTVPSDLPDQLITNSQENSNPVLRDYANQHLGHLHEEGGIEGELLKIEEALWEATYQQEGTAAGSALIALNRAQESGRLQTTYNLEQQAINILQKEYSDAVKISALGLLVENQDYTQLVKELRSDKNSFGLRLKINNLETY